MKKLNYMLLCMITLYLAGMYRYLPLMALGVLEVVFLPVSYGLSRYFYRNLSVRPLRYCDSAQVTAALPCAVELQNGGKLPITHFRIRVLFGYGPGTKQDRKYIYGGSECGRDVLRYEVNGMFCGMMYLYMDRLQVYDYLSLFSASRKLKEEVKIAVFPQERALHIELPSLCCQENCRENEPAEKQAATGGAEVHNEVKQLREYQVGDSMRYIHWNQSARMDQLMVKEYEKEWDAMVLLYLDLSGMGKADAGPRSRFYELVSAMVLGLLKKAVMVKVFWYEGQQKCIREVSNVGQCREMLLALYQTVWPAGKKMEKSGIDKKGVFQGCFQLNLELKWYWEGSLIYQFSQKEELYDEITHKIFVI